MTPPPNRSIPSVDGLYISTLNLKYRKLTCDCILSLSLHKYKFEDYPGKFAVVGFVWDSENQVFYDTQPYPSWSLNTQTWQWVPPVEYPFGGKIYEWNENNVNWEEKILLLSE